MCYDHWLAAWADNWAEVVSFQHRATDAKVYENEERHMRDLSRIITNNGLNLDNPN